MQGSQELAPDQEGSSLRAPAQHESDPSGATLSLERAPGGMQQTPSRFKAEEAEPEESSVISVRSRRSRPSRRPRRQQQGQAPGTASAEATVRAATAAHDQAPDAAGSQMPQHARKRARVEPVQALARAGAGSRQQASAPRPVQAFTPVDLPQRLSTPEAAEIRRDMTAQNAPGTLHSFHAAGSQTPQPASQQPSSPLLTPDVQTPQLLAPQAARGRGQVEHTPARPAPDHTQELHQGPMQRSTPKQAEPSVPMQLQGSGAPLSTQTRAMLGSLESVWAARQPTLPVLAASAPAQQHAMAPAPGPPTGPTPALPSPDQQALLSALLKAISRHRQPGTAAGQSEAPPRSESSPGFPLRPKALRRGLSPQPSAFRAVEQAAAAVSAPAMDPLAILAHLASQQTPAALSQQQRPSAPDNGQGMLAVSQMLAQQPGSLPAGDSAMRERHPDLWRRVYLAGQPGQVGQADQAQPAAPEFGQPLEQNFKSLSNQDPSSLIFRARSLLPNPFAQLSSLPLRAKLPDLATPQKKPSRRRAAMPDLIEGGGDSDTVSVLSQHHSQKPEPEVTGPQGSYRTNPEAPDSEAARVRKGLAGALDFSGSSKPGLPTQLQSFSQEYAPKGTVLSEDIAKAARSALLAGQPSSTASMGRVSMHFRQSDVSAASYQVLDTLLSQAHREGAQIMSSDLDKLVAKPPAPAAAPAPVADSPKAALMASARSQLYPTPVQTLLQKPSVTGPQAMSPSADTGEGGNLFGIPPDKAERRKANNRESARRTRAKKTGRLTELEEENGQLKTQLQGVQQQLGELRVLLQTLPQISQHQRQLMEENENLKLEVQGLRSLMQGFGPAGEAAVRQPPGASQPPAGFQGGLPQP